MPKPRLEQVQPPSPGVAADLLSGVSPSGTILRSFPRQKPRLSKVLPNPIPTANVLSGVSGSRRATGRCLTQKPRLVSVKPCGCGAGGWPAQRNPSRRTRLGLGINQGCLGFAHHRDVLNHQRAAIGGDYPQEDLIELLGGFNVNIHLGAVHISATNYIIRQQLVDR